MLFKSSQLLLILGLFDLILAVSENGAALKSDGRKFSIIFFKPNSAQSKTQEEGNNCNSLFDILHRNMFSKLRCDDGFQLRNS